MSSLLPSLRAACPNATVWDSTELASRDPGFDARNFGATALVRPADTAGVAALVKFCAARGLSLVAQGGRTGLTGAAATVEGQIICDLGGLNRVEEIDPFGRVAIVGAGTPLSVLQEAAAAHALDPGIDLAARGSCTIGGMVSTNAGGIMAFRNGTMRHRVLGLEAVLPDGSIFSDLTRVLKTSAGYDLKHLFIGAEGTLGIVTRVALRLDPVAGASATALVGVPDAASAQRIVRHFLERTQTRLNAAEILWQRFAAAMNRMLGFTPGQLPLDAPCLLVLELGADSVEAAREALEDGLAAIWEEAGIVDGLVASSVAQAEAIWRLREETEMIERMHHLPPSFDVSVPAGGLDTYVARIEAGLKAIDATYAPYVFGHLADGNLHISINTDGPVPHALHEAIEDVLYEGLQASGGSFSAEHGVGLDKRDAYERHVDPVKQALAPSRGEITRSIDFASRQGTCRLSHHQPLRGLRCRRAVVAVAVYEDHHHGALDQQEQLSRPLAGRRHLRLGKQARQLPFHQRLVLARHRARGMAVKVGELDREASEARSRPARLGRPCGQSLEQLVDQLLGAARQVDAVGLELGEGALVLRGEHRRQQRVLAVEMVVERLLGDAGGDRDLVHADAEEPAAAKQLVGRLQYRWSGLVGRSGHGAGSAPMYTR
ncbi:MAG: FAD-binding oxidoreductase [Mesorhizobium sp.]|nr:MAG: FAD-binding oxidoreductase [Mesorhizobium sp.]